jgi:predicted RNA binding protein YcfA (HicA-like mRNA interferase family)
MADATEDTRPCRRPGETGYTNRGGKGSHRNFVHPNVAAPVTISGKLGDDAKAYQIRAVKRTVEKAKA